jgi:transposase
VFIRAKKRGDRTYLQIVENERNGRKVVQKVVATLGRLDLLRESGRLDSLLRSGLRFSEKLLVLDALDKGQCTTTNTHKIGPVLLMQKLWNELGIAQVIRQLTRERRFGFDIERVIFTAVLQRLFCPGSDRFGERWMRQYDITGVENIDLHHFYRAMAWLGAISFSAMDHWSHTPRRIKDDIEEELFGLRRTLFSDLSMVFMDTTSLYFEGEGGLYLGEYGNSKDHRPDLKQVVVAIILDNQGNPLCSEIIPGNITDVTTLVPVAQRLKSRFGIEKICIVADRGMISDETIKKLEDMRWEYILGVRMRRCNEVRDDVLLRGGKFTEVHPERIRNDDPAPLKAKEVKIGNRRYVVCHNEEQARKDRYDRQAIIDALRDQLRKGDKSLVGNKGYRRYLKCEGTRFEIDEDKIQSEEIFDGKWVLRTNTKLPFVEVALQYKQLWTVEDIFRTMKSIMETRPIFHKCDETIAGHVFCSFLALLLRKKLHDMITARGWKLEWADIVRDVDAIIEVNVTHGEKKFTVRTETTGVAGKVFQAVGVALPPVLQGAEKCGTTPVPAL